MKSDKLQAAITMIKDEYIEEAQHLISGHKTDSGSAGDGRRTVRLRRRIYMSMGTAAAVLLIVVGAGVKMAGNITEEKADYASVDAAYEEHTDVSGRAKSQEKNGQSANITDGTSAANPVSDTTSADIREESGIGIVLPDGADVVRWTKIDPHDGGEPLYQAEYMYGADAYCFRIQKTGTLKDISGMYYDWTSDEGGDGQTPGSKAETLYTLKMTDEGQGVAYWLVNSGESGYTCSVSMTEGAAADKLDVMYRHFMSTVALPEA